MSHPVDPKYLEVLNTLPEFHKAFDEKGMAVDEFVNYGGFKDTISSFIADYDNLCRMIRSYIIG